MTFHSDRYFKRRHAVDGYIRPWDGACYEEIGKQEYNQMTREKTNVGRLDASSALKFRVPDDLNAQGKLDATACMIPRYIAMEVLRTYSHRMRQPHQEIVVEFVDVHQVMFGPTSEITGGNLDGPQFEAARRYLVEGRLRA